MKRHHSRLRMSRSSSRCNLQGPNNASTISMHSLLQDKALFDTLQTDGSVKVEDFIAALEEVGLEMKDLRLAQSRKILDALKVDFLDFDQFNQVVSPCTALIERALNDQLTIRDWEQFVSVNHEIFHEVEPIKSGANAGYIPELAEADPEVLGMSFCSIDGQKLNIGKCDVDFSIQSASKPLSYMLALQEHGEEFVHRFVGREPSGRNFNELCVNPEGIPHNPMINSGAIMVCSLIAHGQEPSARFGVLMDLWQKLTANHPSLGFSNTTYLSERASANRNFCLGYMMQEKGAFKHGKDKDLPHRPWPSHALAENLEFYFQQCSIELNVEACSIVAATLANGGINPFTKEKIFDPECVRHGLSLMLSCGMYDYSGEWAYLIGLPAKSGVSGVVLLIVPNVGGFAIHSPRLDEIGNSVRGVEFCKGLVKRFALTLDDQFAAAFQSHHHLQLNKLMVTRPSNNKIVDMTGALCSAAAQNDLEAMVALIASGADLNSEDYDGRTPLHLAASEGSFDVVKYLILKGCAPNPVDRMGGTPLSDARRENHKEVADFLLAHGAQMTQSSEEDALAGQLEGSLHIPSQVQEDKDKNEDGFPSKPGSQQHLNIPPLERP